MSRFFFVGLMMFLIAGCSGRINRSGIMSQELPLTLDDIAEIRAGEKNNEKVLWEYQAYKSPKLETYLNAIAANVAEVSTRPHLPYRVIILDTEEVNIFGGPGGFIYITRGMLNFVESESEIAGLIAHEIGHISHSDYAEIPHQSKAVFVYKTLLKGSELAKDSIGTYGTALNYGMKGIGKAAPYISRQFGHDAEIVADEKAVEYLMAAGYDPRGLQKFLDRLCKIEMENVGRFVVFLNTHPPFPDRRQLLNGHLGAIKFDEGKIEFKKDTLSEVRQVTANAPDSIVFMPQLGVHTVPPLEMEQPQQDKDQKFPTDHAKRWGWF